MSLTLKLPNYKLQASCQSRKMESWIADLHSGCLTCIPSGSTGEGQPCRVPPHTKNTDKNWNPWRKHSNLSGPGQMPLERFEGASHALIGICLARDSLCELIQWTRVLQGKSLPTNPMTFYGNKKPLILQRFIPPTQRKELGVQKWRWGSIQSSQI